MDEEGIGGFGEVEAAASFLLELLDSTKHEGRHSLTVGEARALNGLVLKLSDFDKCTLYPARFTTDRGGRYKRKKGIIPVEGAEACAR